MTRLNLRTIDEQCYVTEGLSKKEHSVISPKHAAMACISKEAGKNEKNYAAVGPGLRPKYPHRDKADSKDTQPEGVNVGVDAQILITVVDLFRYTSTCRTLQI